MSAPKPALKCIFCDFSGTLKDLRRHSATCAKHPMVERLKPVNERRYFDVLVRIANDYMGPEQLRRKAESKYGLSFAEALEMAYENIQEDARQAVKGRRRPEA